jgi:hypothetical protein
MEWQRQFFFATSITEFVVVPPVLNSSVKPSFVSLGVRTTVQMSFLNN